eukprot:UN27438
MNYNLPSFQAFRSLPEITDFHYSYLAESPSLQTDDESSSEDINTPGSDIDGKAVALRSPKPDINNGAHHSLPSISDIGMMPLRPAKVELYE